MTTIPWSPDPPSVNGVGNLNVSAEDELDIESLRLNPEALDSLGVRKVLTVVPVRRPSRHLWIRVHPTWRLDTMVFEHKEDDRAMYLVSPELLDVLADEVIPVRLYSVMSRQGTLTLWPVRLPGSDGKIDEWSRSAHTAAEQAMGEWIRMASNRALGAYEIHVTSGRALPDPVWPADVSFNKIVNLAFKDRRITTDDHPVLRQLHGRA